MRVQPTWLIDTVSTDAPGGDGKQKGRCPHRKFILHPGINYGTSKSVMRIFEGRSRMDKINCQKFEHCAAPICPLDKHVFYRDHLKGERTCLYLREYAKAGFTAISEGRIPQNIGRYVELVYPVLIQRYAPLKKQLKRASLSNSKIQQCRRLP